MKEVRNIMRTNVAGEITKRESPRGFMLHQGTEQGIDQILKNL